MSGRRSKSVGGQRYKSAYIQRIKTSVSTDESVAINFDEKPKVIISSSGMCEAGRIRHHLKHNLCEENV